MGGWNASPGSWRRGFRPKPSKGGFIDLSNGFDRNKIKSKKEKMIIFCIPRILLKKMFFGIFLLIENKKVKKVKISIHNNIEPSWFPHKPETLYIIGFAVWELLAIRLKENSELIKPYSKITNDMSTKIKFKLEIFLNVYKYFSL